MEYLMKKSEVEKGYSGKETNEKIQRSVE